MREFFNTWSLLAVVLFALNNHYLKSQYHNTFTGKLSDFTACFFIPLLFTALLGLLYQGNLRLRFIISSAFTTVVFGGVKLIPSASNTMNSWFSYMTENMGLGPSINRVDPTDLIALMIIPLAFGLVIRPLEKQSI